MSVLLLDKSKRLDIHVRRGASINKTIPTIIKDSGDPFDFTGITGSLQVLSSESDRSPNILFEDGNGLTLDENGITLTKPYTIWTPALRRRKYIYYLWMTSGDEKELWLNGYFIINEGVTAESSSTERDITIDLNGDEITLQITSSIGGGGGTGVTDGDKGDITVSDSGAVWTIDNEAVTLAKMAKMAAVGILGNNVGVDQPVISLTSAQVTALLNQFTESLKGLVPSSNSTDTISNPTSERALFANGRWNSIRKVSDYGGDYNYDVDPEGVWETHDGALLEIKQGNNGFHVCIRKPLVDNTTYTETYYLGSGGLVIGRGPDHFTGELIPAARDGMIALQTQPTDVPVEEGDLLNAGFLVIAVLDDGTIKYGFKQEYEAELIRSMAGGMGIKIKDDAGTVYEIGIDENGFLYGVDILADSSAVETPNTDLITFDRPRSYGVTSPYQGDFTGGVIDITNAKRYTQTIRHNDATPPAFPAICKKLGGEYIPNVDNYIIMEYFSPTIILYTISQVE